MKAEYLDIAERRVRLGLVLAETGRSNNIQVSQEDVSRAIAAEARNYPGQEQAVIEFLRKNADAREAVTAPLYEDKVVDFILEMATVSDRSVSVDELMRDPDDEPAAAPEKPEKKKAKGGGKKAAPARNKDATE